LLLLLKPLPVRLQMTRGFHAVVQDPNDGNAVRCYSKINHVPSNVVAAITWADMIAGHSNHWRACQLDKGRSQHINVVVRLLLVPLPASVEPDILQVIFCRRRKAIFSHV